MNCGLFVFSCVCSRSAVKVDFLSISYRQLEKQVADDVNVAMERVCGTLEQESFRLTQTMGETIFELYTSLKILKGFREFLPLKLVFSFLTVMTIDTAD